MNHRDTEGTERRRQNQGRPSAPPTRKGFYSFWPSLCLCGSFLPNALKENAAIGPAAGPVVISPAVAVLTYGVSNLMLKCVAVLAGGVLVLAGLHLHGHGCPGARVLALVGLDVCTTAAPAEDKKEDKDKSALSGTWVMKGGEMKIVFSDKDVMKVYPH